ncbi:MAG: MarR family transcriptional regulator [Pseudomonadota bacterium]
MDQVLSKYDFKSGLGYKLTRAATILQFAVDQALEPQGLTRMSWIVLASVRFDGKSTVTQVARHIEMERTAVSRIVSQLERDGVLARTKSLSDGRATALGVTEKGEDLCQKVPDIVQAAAAPHLMDLSPNQVTQLGSLLDVIEAGDAPFMSGK